MSEIICQWLNEELGLSKRVEPKYFAKEFATGYLIGEVLHKYQLQDDFDQFSQSRAAISKLNNFTRIEPTLHLLGIPFDQNFAQDVIGEQHGAATRLLYQMYIALQKKKKSGLTGVAMETMRPAAPAKLQSIGTEMYRERLKTIIPRQTNVNLQKVTEQFELKAKEMNGKLAQMHNGELNKLQKVQEQLRLEDIEKLRRARRRQTEIMARIQAAIVQIPKPPLNRTLKAIEAQKMLKRRKEAEYVYKELERFEKTAMRKGSSSSISPSTRTPTLQRLRSTASVGTALLKLDSSDDYVKKIQKRLEEDTVAREQREKRRRRILMEQLTAHGAQEEILREEQLITRLMRQSQQERRIAVQLMQIRHEKDVLKQNRIFREKQYEERRKKEFQEALDREAALQKQAKLDCEEQIRKVQELHDMIAAERAEARYKKHYLTCQQVMGEIVDIVTKTGEYRELTNRLIPAKLMREWKELFFTGYPLYEEASIDPMPSEPSAEQLLEVEKESLLDEKDYEEYKAMSGEWVPPKDLGFKAPAPNNNILGHVVGRLLEIVHPPKAPTPPPVFPPFPIKGCVLGKLFSGKSTCLKYLAQAYGVQVLDADSLVNKAVQAYCDNEMESTMTLPEPAANDQESKLVDSTSSAQNDSEAPVEESITKEMDLNEIPQDQISKSSDGENAIVKPSEQAQLGQMLEKQLRKGKGASDDLLIKIIIHAIKHIPENTGWILDGFPTTVDQARLFEKALTGIDSEKARGKNKRAKRSSLVKNPTGHKDSPPPFSALDFAILIDISDSAVLHRAAQPPEEAEPPVSQESISSNTDTPKDNQAQARDHIQHRIIGFLDHWEKLEKWLSAEQSILIKVNGEVEEEALRKKIEEVFLSAIFQKQNKGTVEEKKEEILSPPPPPPPVTPPPPEPTTDSRPSSPAKPQSPKKGRGYSRSPKGSAKRKDRSAEKKEKKADTPKGKDTGQKSPKSGTPRGRSPGKKSVTPAPPETPEPIPPGPPPVLPGTAEWVYVDEPLPQDIPEYLAPYWENIDSEYGNTIKTALRNLRKEQLIVINYLYDIRSKFKNYLKRPDHKQEFVSQWQSDFTSLADDMWEDEETKAELHQRVDDLQDRLWDICDKRKDEAEHERSDIMNEGWLADHVGIFVNHFFSLMQAEVDRFQDTSRLLHDYYQGMESKIPSEATKEFTRIPLLDIFTSDMEGESEKPTRISLVPRRPQSPEQNPVKQRSKTTVAKDKEEQQQLVEITKQFLESDEKLIVDTWQTALYAITNMVAHEKQMKEMEEEKEQQALEMKEKERLKASRTASMGSGKGSKMKPSNPKSPKGKRGGKSPGPAEPTPPIQTSEESAELQKKQEIKLKIKQEYFGALECEEAAAKSRLELIKSKAIEVCQDLLSKAEQAYKDMEMWLGARFLDEMSSIEKLIHVASHHIETSTRILYELVLEQGDFYISSDVKVIPDPPPPPPPLPIEKSVNATLKISQLSTLYEQFIQVAPEGLVSSKLFSEILADLTMNIRNDALPDLWMNLSHSAIQEITSALCLNSDVVNWRTFLLSTSLPWPYPSVSQLLDTLHRFQDTDEDRCGTIDEESYKQAQLWFTGKAEETENSTDPPFNRLEHLIKFFFIMFADQQRDPPLLDYTEMLLYFASHPDPKEGFYRALSVATGKLLQKNPEDNVLLKSLPSMDPEHGGMEEESVQNTAEATISLEEVLCVFEHGASKDGDNHRFSALHEQTGDCSKSIKHIFSEFNTEILEPIAVETLMKHPAFQDLVENCQLFKLPDIHGILHNARRVQSSEGERSTPCSQ